MMCFSAQQSFGFAALGASAVGVLLHRGRSWKYVGLALYFTIMEVLQFAQYMVIDRCDSKVNQLLTWLAFVHVSLQPFAFNEFVWGQPQAIFMRPVVSPQADQIIHWTVRRLALAASGCLILKGTPAFLQLLGIPQSAILQQLLGPKIAAYVSSGHCSLDTPDMLCGQRLCSFSGKYHIAWSVPQIAHSYYIPSAFLHSFFFFVPALVLGGVSQWVLSVAALLTGPVLTEVVLAGDAEARRYEWATIWCMFSLGQVLLLFAVELVASKALLGKFHLPAAQDDLRPGSVFSNLLQLGGTRRRSTGKRSSIGGAGTGAEAATAAWYSSEAVLGSSGMQRSDAAVADFGLRPLIVAAQGPDMSAAGRASSQEDSAGGMVAEGLGAHPGSNNDGQLTPRRSVRLHQRSLGRGR